MKKKIASTGGLLGLINFLYYYFLFSLVSRIFYHKNIFAVKINLQNGLLLLFVLMIFIIYAIIELRKIFKDFNRFIKSRYSNKIIEMIEFLLFSGIIFLLFYYIFRIQIVERSLIQNSTLIFCFLVIGAIAFRRIFNFFTNIILLNIYFNYYSHAYTDQHKVYKIYDYEEFLNRAYELINQTKRFNMNLGFLIIDFQNTNKIKNIQHQSFLRKQINFLLIENSRNYEHWGRSKDKDVYIKILEVRDKDEIMTTSERFFSLLKQHAFYILNKPYKLEFKMLGVYLKKSYFEENELNFMDEFLLILRQNMELVRRMEEDFKIIELE